MATGQWGEVVRFGGSEWLVESCGVWGGGGVGVSPTWGVGPPGWPPGLGVTERRIGGWSWVEGEERWVGGLWWVAMRGVSRRWGACLAITVL